jgi:FtsH-binding integral membrane protein
MNPANKLGGERDSSFFGKFFEIFGGVLLSLGVAKFINSLNFSLFNSSVLMVVLGFLFFALGFHIPRREIQEIKQAIINLLVIISLLLVLCFSILIKQAKF